MLIRIVFFILTKGSRKKRKGGPLRKNNFFEARKKIQQKNTKLVGLGPKKLCLMHGYIIRLFIIKYTDNILSCQCPSVNRFILHG